MFDWIATPEGWIALATLFALEVVLGIDNIVFLSILVGRLPAQRRELARKLGLGLALSKGFVEAMGGTLDPEDTPGGGLTMVVSLPLSAATDAP